MNIITVGIDLAKNVFAVHGVDDNGKPVLVKPNVSRADSFSKGDAHQPAFDSMAAIVNRKLG